MTRAVVALQPMLGLSNRLRAISSFRVLAHTTGREFRLCWAPSQGFSDEELSALVRNDFARIDESDFASMDQVTDGIQRHALFDPDASIAYSGFHTVESLLRVQLTSMPTPFEAEYKAELRRWRPAPALQHIVDDLVGDYDRSTVGVHVRRGDAIVDPTRGWKFRISSDGAFFRAMDHARDQEPTTTFFLATDDAATEQRFKTRYGSALLTNPTKRFVASSFRAPKDNQRDAAIDLFALSHTSRILGNHASTFSSLAASIGSIALERVTDNSFPARVSRKLRRRR